MSPSVHVPRVEVPEEIFRKICVNTQEGAFRKWARMHEEARVGRKAKSDAIISNMNTYWTSGDDVTVNWRDVLDRKVKNGGTPWAEFEKEHDINYKRLDPDFVNDRFSYDEDYGVPNADTQEGMTKTTTAHSQVEATADGKGKGEQGDKEFEEVLGQGEDQIMGESS
jgi:hypothetical protein